MTVRRLTRDGVLRLGFEARERKKPRRGDGERLVHDLSAIDSDGTHLWLASDETRTVERLGPTPGGYGDHEQFDLDGLVGGLEGRDGEVDVEGLAIAGPPGERWLWVMGSHARCRPRPDVEHDDAPAAELDAGVARCVLARLPLVPESGVLQPIAGAGARRARWLPLDGVGALRTELAADPRLRPFLELPAKENGLDLEGIAIAGDDVLLGLRGPVIRGHAIVLAVRLGERGAAGFGVDAIAACYLDLGGLGVRDLAPIGDGDELLILAGPTMALDGPAQLWRWRRGGAGFAPPGDLALIGELATGRGDDHPEGIALLAHGGGRWLAVVHDSPAATRVDGATIEIDLHRAATLGL